MAKKLVLWTCRLLALLVIFTICSLCVLMEGHGTWLLRIAAIAGSFMLCGLSGGMLVLTMIPAVFSGGKAKKPVPHEPMIDVPRVACAACENEPATRYCATHKIPVGSRCAALHTNRGCTMLALAVVNTPFGAVVQHNG